MLKTRVIPCILLRNFGVVKTIEFASFRPLGVAVNFARVYNAREVDELILLDIDATPENRGWDLEIVYDVAEECFMPLTVGGGIRSTADMSNLLRAGADKISINSAAVENPELISEGAYLFGKQCIVVSIDAKLNPDSGAYQVVSHCGNKNHPMDVKDWAKEVEKRGAGEIYLSSIDNDGKMEGYDLELIRQVSKSVSIPVICSGGAGKLNHFAPAILEGGAHAVSAASIFHYTQVTPMEIKTTLQAGGVPTRVY